MKRNNYINKKPTEKLNVYSGAPVNKGFYNRNLHKAKKLYMDEYDRLKQQILKRRQDKELNDLLSGYYKDYNKLTKKHPHLSKYENYDVPNPQKSFDLNQFELKKKNINALFFKYDKVENELDFDATDKLIESMKDGSNMSYLNCLELKNDYKKRLNGKKPLETSSNIIINNNKNNNFLQTENKISLSIIGDEKKNNQENILVVDSNKNLGKTDEKVILTNINNINNPEQVNDIDEIKEENLDELTRYKNFIKKNKFPCFDILINPLEPTNYIPPTFIPEIPEEEKTPDKKENNEELEYDDFIDNFDINNNKEQNENNLKAPNNNIINDNPQLKLMDNIIKEDIKGENSNSQNNINNENKNNSNMEQDYENEKFDDVINNSNNNNENKDIVNIDANNDLNNINVNNNNKEEEKDNNQNNNGDLKMLNDIIQDNAFPKFDQIINPYYQTNYLPPDIFTKSNAPELQKSLEDENKYMEPRYQISELPKKNEIEEDNKNNSNLPILGEKIINNENPMLENMINSNYSNNVKDNFNLPNDNNNNNENEDINHNNSINVNNGGNIAVYNQYGVNMGNDFVSVENMIKINQNLPNENKEIKKDDEKNDEDEYADFEVDN